MKRLFGLLLLANSLFLVACGGESGSGSTDVESTAPGEVAIEEEVVSAEDVEITPDIVVEDQVPEGTWVLVDDISTPQDGWIVVYRDADGEPSEVLGQEQVFLGVNPRVSVDLGEAPAAGSKLIAVLHQDGGTLGAFEFPGDDEPVEGSEGVVKAAFTVEAAE